MKFLKGLLKFFTGIIAVILCVVIFSLQISLHLIVDTKSYLSENNVNSMITNLDINKIIEDEDIVGDLKKEIYASALEANLSKDDVHKILESESLKQLAGAYIGSSINSILYNKEVQKPTINDLVIAAEENYSIIESSYKAQNKEITKQEVIDAVKTRGQELINEIPDVRQELLKNNDTKDAIKYVQEIYDIQTVVAIVGVIVLLTLIIAIIRYSSYSWMMWLAIPTIISSLFALLIGISPSLISKKLDYFEIKESMFNFISNDIFGGLFNRFLISGGLCLTLGIILIIIYNIINNKKNLKNEQIDM